MNWDDLNMEKSFSSLPAYKQNKLSHCLFTIELEKRLKDAGVVALSLHPGQLKFFCSRQTSCENFFFLKNLRRRRDELEKKLLWDENSMLMFAARPLVKLFGKSSKSGAEATIHCATSREILK